MFGYSADLAPVIRVLPLLAVLAGCAAPLGRAPAPDLATPQPRQAILYQNTVTVQFSDGALCVAPRPNMARAWSGRLSGCPHLLDYRVTLPTGSVAPRRVLVQLGDGTPAVLTLDQARFGLPQPQS